MSAEEVTQAFATLRRHLPASLRQQEAALEAAWFNGGPLPVDLPARFRAAAEVATDARLYYALHGVGAALHELADLDSEQVAAVGRELLGEVDR